MGCDFGGTIWITNQYEKVYALYDLAVAHEVNDYSQGLKSEYKYPQLEIIYYKAWNAAIKGDTDRETKLVKMRDCMS